MRRALSNIRDNPGREDASLADVIPNEEDFDLFEECLDIMVRVAQVSEAFSADNYPTINRIMSLLFEIQSTIQKKLSQEPSHGAEFFLKALSNELFQKRFPKCGGMVAAYAFGNMLNPFYRGVGVECISQNFQEMYLLITNHENHQMWLAKQAQG